MLGVEELLEIFNSRVVMNSGAIIGVTDLDAVYLMHDSQLVVVEFKRKYPAVKYRPLFLPVTSSRGLGGLVYKLKKSHSTVCQSTYVLSRCFGLDLSHVKNFIYLNSAKVKYVYMILNRVRKEPSELIDFSFKNYGSGLINFKEVEYSDFVGVCETDGEHSETEGEQRAESGSWDDGLRYQLTILESSFFRGFDVGRVQR
jgi:hypothetical protein